MRHLIQRRAPLAALFLLLLAGCDTGPTEPRTTTSLTGTLTVGQQATSTVTLEHTGNLRATLVKIDHTAADGTVTRGSGTLTFGVGASAATCTATGSFGLLQGSVVSIGLAKGDYCVVIAPGALVEGASFAYEVKLEITD
jgi:hypothetical protein